MLEFNTQISTPEAGSLITRIDPEGFQDRMARNGHNLLDLIWEGYGPPVFVRDDVMFLCEAYQELASFIEKGGKHGVFLADGGLQMEATREGSAVHVVCTHVPGLQRGLMEQKKYTVSLGAYVGAWTRFMRALIDLGNSPVPPEAP